jgi:hypothetical protein
MNLIKNLIASSALALGLALPLAVQAQDYGAMVQQSMAAMNANIQRGQQQVNQMVQQRMQDPAVQQAWQRYLQQSGGRPQMNYATFTYNYIYTAGFSSAGIAHARANESGMQQREMQAWRGLQQAQANRAAAMQNQRDHYVANQQEAGRALMGNSTYVAPNGQPLVLPHTWQRNGTYEHQGHVYHVDQSGQYYVRATDGWWYPLGAR